MSRYDDLLLNLRNEAYIMTGLINCFTVWQSCCGAVMGNEGSILGSGMMNGILINPANG